MKKNPLSDSDDTIINQQIEDRISIITIIYNSDKFIQDYFLSIFNSTYKPIEILLYDGGSSDNSIKMINKYQKKYPEIILYRGKNIGFAAGNNFLAKKAKGKYLFVLNPDTKLEKNCLRNLITNKNRTREILVPKQMSFNGKMISFGNGMDILGCPTSGRFFADGAAIFISKFLFNFLGCFDPDYFMFQEDLDLSWRAHLYGINLFFDNKALVYHFSGGSVIGGSLKSEKIITTPLRRYYGERNVYQNILKNYSILTLMFVLPINIIINFFEFIFFFLAFRPKLAFCYPRVWANVIKNLPAIMRKRREVQKKRIISDWLIFKKTYLGSAKLKLLFKNGIPLVR